jgi:mRNA (2'-O-methyladenosine-N6-)-methyltransferase
MDFCGLRKRVSVTYEGDDLMESKSDNSDADETWEPPDKAKIQKRCGVISDYGMESRVHAEVKLQCMTQGLSLNRRVSSDSRRAREDPLGKPCPLLFLDELKGKILEPDSYFPPECLGVNVLLPEYNPIAQNLLQFYEIEGQRCTFEMDEITAMTEEEIEEMIADLNDELSDTNTPEEIYWLVSPYHDKIFDSVSIQCDVRTFDWADLGRRIQFDVILMDPPWKIQTTEVTRGLELRYDQLALGDIAVMPLPLVQKDGFLFMWVVTSLHHAGVRMLELWGYEVVDTVTWFKVTPKGCYQPSHGFFMQHDKEVLLVGKKGKGYDGMVPEKYKDSIAAWRNPRQSHKPNQVYSIIEETFPNGRYLEVFARSHNVRDRWVSLGLELPR